MKKIKATRRVLGAYRSKHEKALNCSKCDRKIRENEPLLVTTHHVNYYCSDCSKIIEG